MSAAPQRRSPNRAKLLVGLLLPIVAGVGLAWAGAGSLRGETTASGLVFRTVEEGSGPVVKPVDGVLIEYEGRLEDGTVFDSTEGRGPAPIIPSQVIPGFAEALTRMQKGGRYEITIPPSLGYGASVPAGGPIPANATLKFDVHVVQVVPNAGVMQGQPQGAPGAPPQAESQPQAPPQ